VYIGDKMKDFHVHTAYSDGEHSPREVIQYAIKAGLEEVAITDHDTLDGLEEAIQTANQLNMALITGIELSVDANSSHILGYFFNYKKMQEDPEYQEIISKIRRAKRTRAAEICEKSKLDPILMQDKQGNNYQITFDLEDFGDRAIYTGHFGAKMCQVVEQNLGVRLDVYDATHLFFKAKKYEKFATTKIKDLDPNYNSAKVDGEKTLLDYVKLEKDNKYWHVSEDKSAYPSAKEAIDLIHKHGGIAIIAHPDEGTTRERVEFYLGLGANGIEVYSPKNNGGIPYYEGLVKKKHLIATQGTDWHGKTYSPNKILGFTGAKIGKRLDAISAW
jgi:3',5'-nucleoside bisphosphate phosphatase